MIRRFLSKYDPKKRSSFLISIVLVLTWVGFCVWITKWVGDQRDRQEKRNLLNMVKIAASGFDPTRIETFSQAMLETANPDYAALKVQLVRMKKAAPQVRFFYLMIQRIGNVVFLADSEPSGSQEESPPGQVYDEASAILMEAFLTERETLDGPLVDRWGTWISAYVPIFNSENRLIAVLGADIDASHWAAMILRSRLTTLLFLLLTTGILVFFLVALRRERDQTQRLRIAQEKLKRQEENLRTFFNLSIDFLMVTDENHRIITVNQAILDRLGYTAEKMIGRSVAIIHPLEFQEKAIETYLALVEGRIDSGIFFVADAKGRIMSVETRLVRGVWNGRPAVFSISRDISELRLSEEKFAKMFSISASPMMLSTAEEGRFVEVNPAFLRTTGYRIEEVIGKTYLELNLYPNPEDRQKLMERLRIDGEIGDFETTFRMRNAEIRYGLLSIQMVKIQDTPHLMSVFNDITERKRTEQDLRENEERFRAITTAALDAIVMIDAMGKIRLWNAAAERIFGFSGQEAMNRHLHTLVTPGHLLEAHRKGFDTFVATGSGPAIGRLVELTALRKNGEEFPVELAISPVFLNESWYAVGIIRDITDRKENESKLNRITSELEETNIHLEAALLRANEMAIQAELANAAKSEFLANMSHEIRTPMNGVIGMTGLLLDTPLTDEQRQYAEIVRSSGESLLSIINDILDFSKVEAGKLILENLDFDLGNTLEDAAEMLAVRAHEKDIELVLRVAADVPCLLRGDPGRLRQIIANLVGNAVKFTQRGEVCIQVGVETDPPDRVTLLFEIIDTGIGIPEDRLDALFMPFVQVDGSTTRKFGGTGLGLAISKRICELMGGWIGAESQKDKGSRFWFTAVFEKQIHPQEKPVIPAPADVAGLHVLVVDKNKTCLEATRLLLTTFGCRAETADDAESAISLMIQRKDAQDPFHTAILESSLPAMNDTDLVRRIQADPRLADTALIAMTALGKRSGPVPIDKTMFSGTLTKPLRRGLLRETLALSTGRKTRIVDTPVTQGDIPGNGMSASVRRRVRILLAEDNPTNQTVALSILSKLGYRADAVADGTEAIEALSRIPYDLVLMDCHMPELDGFEATRKIRNLATGVTDPKVPIIALTANAMKGDRDACIEAGMDDYLAKPIVPKDLSDILGRWLKDVQVDETPISDSQAPASNPDDVFNAQDLLDRLMGDADLAKTIVAGFLTDIPIQLKKLETYLAESDMESATRQAHTIQGASANIGAKAMREIAMSIERLGKSGTPQGAMEIHKRLTHAFGDLEAKLQRDGWIA